MTNTDTPAPSFKYGKFLFGILACVLILTVFYPFLPAFAPLTFLEIILSPFWSIVQQITIVIVNYTAFDVWLARGLAVTIYAMLSFFLVGYIGKLVGSYQFLLKKERRLLFLLLWWGVCILMFFVSKNVNFSQAGEPLKRYHENVDGSIELFPIDMKFHPKNGDSLFLVTKGIIQDFDLSSSEMKRVDITLAKLEHGEIQFFRPSGAPRVWYCKTERGEFELFSRNGHHPNSGEELKPVTREVVFEIEASLQAKEIQRHYDSTLTKSQETERTRRLVEDNQRNKREEYIRKYVAQNYIPPKPASIVVLVIDENGNLNSISTELIRSQFAEKGYQTVSLFTGSFISDKLFGEVFNGSPVQVRKLELSKYVSHLFLGKQSATFTNNPELQNVITANVSLELHVISSSSGAIEDSFVSNKAGAGFNREKAQENALKNILVDLDKKETKFKN